MVVRGKRATYSSEGIPMLTKREYLQDLASDLSDLERALESKDLSIDLDGTRQHADGIIADMEYTLGRLTELIEKYMEED